MKNIFWCFAIAFSSARAQDGGPLSIHVTALLTQNFCTNRTALFSPDNGFYFHPQLGGIGEGTVAYQPRGSRFGVEAGVGVWLWGYKVGVSSEATRGTDYGWRVGQSASGIFFPLRVGYAVNDVLEIKAGCLLVNHLASMHSRGSGMASGNGTVEIQGEAIAYGRTYGSVAVDLSASFRISRRFDAVLRGTLDTQPFPSVNAQYTVTEGGMARTYHFDGGPRMAFLSLGASYRIF